MTTITLTYDKRNKHAQHVIDLILELGLAEETIPEKQKSNLDISLAEIERGDTIECENFENYLKVVKEHVQN